jgi:hypothetical protein
MKNKGFTIILLPIVILLLIPWVAMQYTSEVNWTLFDFAIMAAILLGSGFVCELILRRVKKQER